MQENYKSLADFCFGKRIYSVLSNNNKIKYFEKINGEYVMPITSFNLFDNEGKSLTHVNQHFFMNELVDRLNNAFKKGIFVNDLECIDYLNDLISKMSNDVNLKKLFKGSNLKEINEENFELNKKEIVNYLDTFRFDTFVNYNNVSIFNGSIDKKNEGFNLETPYGLSEKLNNNFNFSSDLQKADIKSIGSSDNFIDVGSVNESDVQEVNPSNNSLVDSFNQVENNNVVESKDNINNVFGNNSDVFDFSSYKIEDNIESVDSNDYFNVLKNDSQSNTQEVIQNNNEINDAINLFEGNNVSSEVVLANPFENNNIIEPIKNIDLEKASANLFGVNNVVESDNNVVSNNGSDSVTQVENNSVINNNDVVDNNVLDMVNPFEANNYIQNNDVTSETVSSNLFDVNNVNVNNNIVNNNDDLTNSIGVNNVVESNNNVVDNNIIQTNNVTSEAISSNLFDVNNVNMNNNIVNNNDDLTNSIGVNNVVESNNNVNANSNLSYIDQVKSRIENNNPQFGAIANSSLNNLNNITFGNEMGKDNFVVSSTQNNEVISDIDSLPEIDSVSNEVIEDKKVEKKKKGKGGIILTFIIVVLILAIAFMVVYNYVL